MPASSVRIVNPPNSLKERASKGGGKKFDDMVASGDQVVEESHGDYRKVAESDLSDLRWILDRIKTSPDDIEAQIDAMFRIVHDMKGQAATFGYPMVTNVAGSLCRFVDRIRESGGTAAENVARLSEIIRLHVDALRLLLTHDMKGAGGPTEAKLLGGLAAAGEKILGGLQAPTG